MYVALIKVFSIITVTLTLQFGWIELTLQKASCTKDPSDEIEFFTLDGYRKCSIACDPKTKVFGGEYDCSCCFKDIDETGDSALWYKIGFFIFLTYGIAATIFGVYLKRRSQHKQGKAQSIITQNSSTGDGRTEMVCTEFLKPTDLVQSQV